MFAPMRLGPAFCQSLECLVFVLVCLVCLGPQSFLTFSSPLPPPVSPSPPFFPIQVPTAVPVVPVSPLAERPAPPGGLFSLSCAPRSVWFCKTSIDQFVNLFGDKVGWRSPRESIPTNDTLGIEIAIHMCLLSTQRCLLMSFHTPHAWDTPVGN